MLQQHKPVVVMEMNHFCLNVLHRITIPDFIEYMCSVFPYLYAIDTDNKNIKNLHDKVECYHVMHEHVVNNRYPNIVGGYSEKVVKKLKSLVKKHSTDYFIGTIYEDESKNLPVYKYLKSGWSQPEADFIWNDGDKATMKFLLEDRLLNKDLKLTLDVVPFVTPKIQEQSYEIVANRTVVCSGSLSSEGNIEVTIPKSISSEQELELVINIPNCDSPKNQGLSDDGRMLGIALKSIKVEI